MGCTASSERYFDNIKPLPRDCNWGDWLTWHQNIVNTVNENEILKRKVAVILGRKLKRVIGPYGLDIINNFSNRSEQNFYVLLRKLELFFYLRRFPRDDKKESIEEYIMRLSKLVTDFGSNYPDVAVKEKITYDLKNNGFLQQITGLVSIRNNIIDLNILNMGEIIFLVNTFESRKSQARQENFLQTLKNNGFVLPYNANCCGRQHLRNKICPAKGKYCYKCHGLNHFARVCNSQYKMVCQRCGIIHQKKKCGAYDKECSRCKKFNHFYWQCYSEMSRRNYY